MVAKDTSFPLELFLLMGESYIGDDDLGRKCHGKRKALEHNLAAAGMTSVTRELYRAFADAGMGRTAVITARKNGGL